MVGFRVQFLLALTSSFGACDWLMRHRRQEVDGGHGAEVRVLCGQRLREVLAQRDGGPRWGSGTTRRQMLYCNVGIGLHLQIRADGAVRGVHEPDEFCRLIMKTLDQGVVSIQGEESGLYLCMTERGLVYTTESPSDECGLKETVEENLYNTYSSALYQRVYLGLSHRGHVRPGTSVTPRQNSAHFLPRGP